MHPIERLRYVARAGAAPDSVLVAEAVPALVSFAGHPGGLLVALRQLIVRQPDAPGLLVLGARMLSAPDPEAAAWALVDELAVDPSGDEADDLVAEQGRHIELVDTVASGPGRVLASPGTARAIARARADHKTVVALTPLGTRLPRLLWQGYLERSSRGQPFMPSTELIDADEVDQFIGPDQAGAGWSSDCSDVAELSSF